LKDDEEGGFGVIFEALSKKLGTTTAVVIVLAVLSIFVFRSSDHYGPLASPFLVGRWESTARLENNAWIREPRPVVLTLYDDGVASLDGLKGSWTFADISRLAVRIEILAQDKVSPGNLYELRVKRGEPLWGTMRASEKVLRFEQTEQGGAVAAVADGIAEVIRRERQKRQELAEKACKEAGWRKIAYRSFYWLKEEGPLDCGDVARTQNTTEARSLKM
jgi:hypothetical protein